MMQKSKIKVYLIFVLILFVGVLFFTLREDFGEIIRNLFKVNILWLILGILFVFLSKYFIGITTYALGVRENDKISKNKIIQIALIYPFFAGITPSSVGGEAFEVFYLKQSGLSYGGSSSIQMQKFILYLSSLLMVNFSAVILNFFSGIVVDSTFVGSTVTLNFIVNMVLLGGCFLITYNRKVKDFILHKGVDILGKIRILKNPDKSRDKIDEFLEKFDDGATKLLQDKKLFWKLIVYNILSLVFLIIAAWPIARAMHIKGISFINLFILATYAKMMCLLVVTPGNSGAAEYCFIYLFSNLISESDIMAYMLIWRFVTYYIPLVVGGLVALHWGRRSTREKVNSTES